MHFEGLRTQEFTCSYFYPLVYACINLFRPCLYITQPTGNSVR